MSPKTTPSAPSASAERLPCACACAPCAARESGAAFFASVMVGNVIYAPPMLLKCGDGSRVLVDVKSKGLVSALDHALTFRAALDPLAIEVPDAGDIDVAIE